MLILVAVTITMAVNGGLFDYAGKANSDTKGAIANEQELANLQANMTVDELIDKYTQKEEEPKTITFKIGNETYTVEEGTTWGAWANSTEGKWTVAEDGKIKCNEGLATEEYIGYEGEAESSSDPISSSGEYDIVITFKIADVAYTATKGMSWIAWVESTYYESEPWELGADNSCVFVYETGCYVGGVTQPNRFSYLS